MLSNTFYEGNSFDASNVLDEQGQAMNLLIVEDNPLILEMLGVILRLQGYKVFQAQMPSIALDILESTQIDGIVSDIRMPGMNGIDFGKLLRAKGFRLPIIYLSGEANGPSMYRKDLIEIGNTRFIVKPSETALLLNTLKEVLSTKTKNS